MAAVALTVSQPSCGLSRGHTSLHYETYLTVHIMYSTQVLGLLQNKHFFIKSKIL